MKRNWEVVIKMKVCFGEKSSASLKLLYISEHEPFKWIFQHGQSRNNSLNLLEPIATGPYLVHDLYRGERAANKLSS